MNWTLQFNLEFHTWAWIGRSCCFWCWSSVWIGLSFDLSSWNHAATTLNKRQVPGFWQVVLLRHYIWLIMQTQVNSPRYNGRMIIFYKQEMDVVWKKCLENISWAQNICQHQRCRFFEWLHQRHRIFSEHFLERLFVALFWRYEKHEWNLLSHN